MKSVRYNLYLSLAFLIYSVNIMAQNSELPQLGKASVNEVIAAMILEEKAGIVVGAGLKIDPAVANMLDEDMKRMIPDPGSLAAKTNSPVPPAAGTTVEIPRLGIPCIVVNDGPAGLRMMGGNYQCTAFPIGSLLASTWNCDLIYQAGQAYGNETLEYGVDVLLAPGLNIQRDPLCGRNFEYFSEDPFLSGKIASAMVRGIQSQGVGTSVKHFVVNNQETDRKTVNSVVSERALREIYLEGFRIAIQEAQPWTVMSSYNLVNGLYTSENPDLLIKILRDDWGYKGLVTSDWISGNDFVAQVKAGNDLLMPGPYQVNSIIQAVNDGQLDEKILDRNVENILNLVLKSPRFKKYQYSSKPNTDENTKKSRIAATEGMVLLKNTGNTLPLSENIPNIALFGNSSYQTHIGGSGSGSVATSYKINIVDGLEKAGYIPNKVLQEAYVSFIKENEPRPTNMLDAMMGRKPQAPEMLIDVSLAKKLADETDIAIITIGRKSGETSDREIENDFNLSKTEKTNIELITETFHSKGKKVIVLLNIGGVIETASWKNIPDAILLTWQPGIEAGNAIADLISGKVNPSGKLAVTFPNSYSDVPSAKNFPGEIVTNDSVITRQVVYEEGIYVGYRYYNTFDINTSYPFGFGLSYTNFTYNNLKLSSGKFKDEITVSVTITNTGKIAGKEIVQLYLSAPKKELDKPSQELKEFAKTRSLNPGESQTVEFTIDAKSLSSFNSERSAWIADAGKYTVNIGASGEDIVLTKAFKLSDDILVARVSKALEPQININELKGK